MLSSRVTPYRKAVVWDYDFVFSQSSDKNCYSLSHAHVAAIFATMTAMSWLTRWDGATPAQQNDISMFVAELTSALLNPVDCEGVSGDSNVRGDRGAGRGADIDSLLDMMRELDMKFQTPDGRLYEAAIPLVDCGCSGGGDSDSDISPVAPIQGASGGANYGSLVTLCDALAILPNYLVTEFDRFLDRIAEGSVGVGIVAPSLIPLAAAVAASVGELEDQLNDPSFLVLLDETIIRSFNDPWTPITRQDFRNFAYRFPLVFNGAPLWAGFALWSEFIDIEQLNQAVANASGVGNDADCAGKFARVGRVPFRGDDSGNSGETAFNVVSGGQSYTVHIAQLSVPVGTTGNETGINIQGETVVGAGYSLSNMTSVGDNLWKRFNVRADNETFASNGTSMGEVAEYQSIAYNLTEVTQQTADEIDAAIASFLGGYTNTAPPDITVNNFTSTGDGNVTIRSSLNVNPPVSGVIDWVVVITR